MYNISTKVGCGMTKYRIDENKMLVVRENHGIGSKSSLYDYVSKNNFTKVAPGIYVAQDQIVDKMFVLSKRCPKGVLSHEDALYFHGLIDREPMKHCITVYSGYNPSRLSKSGYQVFTVKKELLEIGKTYVVNHFGNEVPMYDLERTICDLFRNRNYFEIQEFTTAIKTYVSMPSKDITKLMRYAKLFRVEKIVRQYMEVLL